MGFFDDIWLYLRRFLLIAPFHPNQAGTFWLSKDQGGIESTRSGFYAPVLSISM